MFNRNNFYKRKNNISPRTSGINSLTIVMLSWPSRTLYEQLYVLFENSLLISLHSVLIL